MLSINTNLSSLIAQNSMSSATKLLNQAVERMTTGYKINHSKDNAANYSISTNLTTKINAYMVAEDNCAMGLDMLSTANGSLDQISDKLTRLRDLQTQASNGTYGATSLNAINAEANALVDEINRLYQTAEYNGRKLFETAATPAVATFAMARAATPTTGFIKQISQRNTDTMTTLESVSDSATISSGTYSISTAEELEKLATMTNNGQITGGEFVLGNDIDLSAYSNWTPIGNETNTFNADFDGNGHVISNLNINNAKYAGLFGCAGSSEIKNLGITNTNISGSSIAGVILAVAQVNATANISNCFTTGNIDDTRMAGGIFGFSLAANAIIDSCWSSVDVSVTEGTNEVINTSEIFAGGIAGVAYYGYIKVSNSYSTGNITATGSDASAAGICGLTTYNADVNTTGYIKNSFSTGEITSSTTNQAYGVAGITGISSGALNNSVISQCSYNVEKNPSVLAVTTGLTTSEVETKTTSQIHAMVPTLYSYSTPAGGGAGTGTGGASLGNGFITLQIGTNADSNSQIGFEISFSIAGVDDLRMIGLDTTTDYLSTLDNMLSTVNAKQTEFGAVENRLNSALDEISIQYENLVSTRSTIRDADIAEVSSEYIRQQILQQASATLLSTANQSPSIALQLI